MGEIKRLKAHDLPKYFDHVERVWKNKGLLNIKDSDWVDEQASGVLSQEALVDALKKGMTSLWAVFVGDRIERSIRAEFCTYPPSVRLINYKSELDRPFNPIKDLLPLLAKVFEFFEEKQVYTFYLLRRLDFFASRRLQSFEDNPPLDRYHCYFEEVIPAGTMSKFQTWRDLAGNKTYPVDMGVACMQLKQQYRTYADSRKIMPDTEEYSARPATTYIVGYSEDPNKLGSHLETRFLKSMSSVVGLDRSLLGPPSRWDDIILGVIRTRVDSKPNQRTIVILNLYDHTPGKGHYQVDMFNVLWSSLKNYANVDIVAIGSLASYWNALPHISTEYIEAKRNLRQRILAANKESYRCRLMLVELGVLDSMIKTKPTWPARYLTNAEAAESIFNLTMTNNKTMFVGLSGAHEWNPNLNTEDQS